MNKRALQADILLLFTAAIWGFGFVAQRSGMEHVGPFAFSGIRFILGSLILLPIIFFRRIGSNGEMLYPRYMLLPSLAAGGCLFTAVMLQQFGIIFTTAGNAGFITGFYVVLTPIFGFFLGRKTGKATWIGSLFMFIGLYFISVANRTSINPGDVIIFISTFFWAAHVLLIDRLMRHKRNGFGIDPVELSSGQFAVCGVLSMTGAFLIEPYIRQIVERINPSLLNEGLFSWQPFSTLITEIKTGKILFPVQAIIPVLYGGFGSVGIAYTLQVIAQRDAPPAHAVIILCFEGCFAAIGGIILLSEKAGIWTLIGFIFMLAGMLATQWEVISGGARQTKNRNYSS